MHGVKHKLRLIEARIFQIYCVIISNCKIRNIYNKKKVDNLKIGLYVAY